MITQRNLFLNNLAQTSDFPLMLEIEKAEGVWLYGKDGQKYMDFISGIGVSNVGHRHPKVVQAIKNQIDKYLHNAVIYPTSFFKLLTEKFNIKIMYIDNILYSLTSQSSYILFKLAFK